MRAWKCLARTLLPLSMIRNRICCSVPCKRIGLRHCEPDRMAHLRRE